MRWLLLLCCGCLGCHIPLVRTESAVRLEGPLEGKFSAELAAVSDHGPLVMIDLSDGRSSPCGPWPKVALIDVDGLLVNHNQVGLFSFGENPVALFREKLDRVAADPSVVALVLRINTPGGGVAATDMLWRDLLAFKANTRKPVIACLMDLATGGGYYLASAADSIVAHPGTITGGIGCILNLYNLRDFMGTFNIVPQPVKAGRLIDMGSVNEALSPETRQLLQAMADEYHAQFRAAVVQGRPHLAQAAPETFDGRIFTARQALAAGLVDRIGYLDDALRLAADAARQPSARAVLLRRPNDPARTLYAVTPNAPMNNLVPLSLPGTERSKLPTFLYLWQADPTLERQGGK